MHPALSIIVFTVTTGLAYGWLALAIVLNLLGIASWHGEASLLWSAAVEPAGVRVRPPFRGLVARFRTGRSTEAPPVGW